MYVKNGELHLVWCVFDVKHRAEQKNITLTDKQCNEVLGVMLNRHDCEIGASWLTMDYAIDEVIEG